MSTEQPFAGLRIAISISNSPDMASLGLSDEHLKDATAEVARYLLALGAHLVYGGDLRVGGFTNILFELAARHCRDAEGNSALRVRNYLAWPVHIRESMENLEGFRKDLEGAGVLRCLDPSGRTLDWEQRSTMASQESTNAEWAIGLTSMRERMLVETDARIVLGGQTARFKGVMPGVGEEVLLSLRARQPLYVLGGFGGCARDICEALGLSSPSSEPRSWANIEEFAGFTASDLNNGLTEEENVILARTPHIDQATTLIMRGLAKACASRAESAARAAVVRETPSSSAPLQHRTAHQLWVELITRAATQSLHALSGNEEKAVDSVVSLFETTRALMKQSQGDEEFLMLACAMIDAIRPYTARWHSLRGSDNQFAGPVQRERVRAELKWLQTDLKQFAALFRSLSLGRVAKPPAGLSQPPSMPTLGAHVRMGIECEGQRSGLRDRLKEINEFERAHVAKRRGLRPTDAEASQDGTGLALSGGGIRSATFCLGVVQVLADRGLLPKFDYLSTVSGGGYLGAFLSSRLAPSKVNPESDVNGAAVFRQTFGGKSVDSEQVRHLRNNSKYLLPTAAFARLKLVGLLISGVLVTTLLTAAIPVVAAFIIHMIGRVGAFEPSQYVSISDYLISPWLLLATVAGIVAGVCFLVRPVTQVWQHARTLLDNVAAGASIGAMALLVAVATPWLLGLLSSTPHWELKSVAFTTVVTALTGGAVVKAMGVAWRHRAALSRLFILAGVVLFTVVYLATVRFLGIGPEHAITAAEWTVGGGLLAWILWAAAINLNLTGLHRYYRDSLAKCYLRDTEPISLQDLAPTLPYHLINTTVNLTSETASELRGRGGDFFLMSKGFCGSPLLDYQPTAQLARMNPDLDLATAMAISGAAASTNMGWQTFHQYRTLMAIFNVRLGYWLRWRTGTWAWIASNAFVQVTREMFGLLGEKSSAINVSDGGHLENLAAYELIRRRLKFIVCIDGGMDAQMVCADLNRLQRLVAIDLGYRLEFDATAFKLVNNYSSNYGSLVKIDYTPGIHDGDAKKKELGWMLYIKLAMLGTESSYVLDYRRENPLFPHQSTIDQFFDEAQFEAYRRLGESAARHLLAPGEPDEKGFAAIFNRLAQNMVRDTDPVYGSRMV